MYNNIYTIDQRNNAKNKINKLLALANDKAATDNEKDTALQMAKKLAEKYGFSIKKNESNSTNANNSDNQWKVYKVKMFDRKLVEHILKGAGYRCIINNDCFMVRGDFDIDTFSKIYKEIFKSYENALKAAKSASFNWGRKDSTHFKSLFCIGIYDSLAGEYGKLMAMTDAYVAGYNLGTKFKNFRKEV